MIAQHLPGPSLWADRLAGHGPLKLLYGLKSEAKKSVLLVQISNSIEQLGDLGEDLCNVTRDVYDKGALMSYESIEAVDKIFKKFVKNLEDIKSHFPNLSQEAKIEIKTREEIILDIISKK